MKNKIKRLVTVVAAAAMTAACTIFAFAETGESEAAGADAAFQTALAAVQTDVGAKLAIVLPVALGIFALGFGIKWAMKYFRSLSK